MFTVRAENGFTSLNDLGRRSAFAVGATLDFAEERPDSSWLKDGLAFLTLS